MGCNIQLPFEQQPNRYMHKWITFEYFFIRKAMMLKYSYAFIVMPGGFKLNIKDAERLKGLLPK